MLRRQGIYWAVLLCSLCAASGLRGWLPPGLAVRALPRRSVLSETMTDNVVVETVKLMAVFNTDALNISASQPFGKVVNSVQEARDEVLSLVKATGTPLAEFERFRLDYLAKYLESKHVPIHTGQFLSLAIGGEWHCQYTNALLSRADETLRCRVTQYVEPGANHSHGSIVNRVYWKVEREKDSGQGQLEVRCRYTVNPKGTLSVSLEEHILNIDELPNDPEEVLMTIQRTIPFEFFDPDGAVLQTAYVDPSLRITRVAGAHFRNLFEVFTKES